MAENEVGLPANQLPEQQGLKCVEKLLEIPLINIVVVGVNKLYIDTKNVSRVTNVGLTVVEKGTSIVVNTASAVARRKPLSIPVNALDGVVCVVLNQMKLKTPVLYSTPTQMVQSGKHFLLGNFVAQKIFGALEYGCRFSEAILNIFPEISVTTETTDNNRDGNKRSPSVWKDHYYFITKPIQYVKVNLRKLKKKLRYLRQTYRRRKAPKKGMTPDLIVKIKERKKQPAKKPRPQKGLFYFLTAVPKKAIELLGAVAHEYSKLNVDKDTIIIDKTPSPSDEKCIRHHEDVDSEDSDGLNLASLDDTTYTSDEEPELEITTRSPTTESLSYDSEGTHGLEKCLRSSGDSRAISPPEHPETSPENGQPSPEIFESDLEILDPVGEIRRPTPKKMVLISENHTPTPEGNLQSEYKVNGENPRPVFKEDSLQAENGEATPKEIESSLENSRKFSENNESSHEIPEVKEENVQPQTPEKEDTPEITDVTKETLVSNDVENSESIAETAASTPAEQQVEKEKLTNEQQTSEFKPDHVNGLAEKPNGSPSNEQIGRRKKSHKQSDGGPKSPSKQASSSELTNRHSEGGKQRRPATANRTTNEVNGI